jgi:hypothetical protein
MPILINHIPVGFDIGGDLSLQCRGQHLPRTVADDLIQQRRTQRRANFGVGIAAVVN